MSKIKMKSTRSSGASPEVITAAEFKELQHGKRRPQGKYHVRSKAQRTVDGVVFASGLEARAYQFFKKRLPEGELHLQPVFLLQEGFEGPDGQLVRPIRYQADFLFGPPRLADDDPVSPAQVVVDTKGMRTETFQVKRKIFLYRYRVELHLPKRLSEMEEVVQLYLSMKK
jgi:Protein of unknown function (DUF1064)